MHFKTKCLNSKTFKINYSLTDNTNVVMYTILQFVIVSQMSHTYNIIYVFIMCLIKITLAFKCKNNLTSVRVRKISQ